MEQRPEESLTRGSLTRLLEKVRADRGLDLSQYRPRYVERRVATRLHALGLQTYRQYSARLDTDPAEYARLLDALTINVTQFFRDPSVFEFLRAEVLPALFAAKAARHQRIVRIWSAGCATGQEPYSLAMAVLDETRHARSRNILPTVIGTDIDHTALEVARRAVYPVAQLAHIPESDRARFVEVTGDHFHILPEVTRHVRLQYLNLFQDEPIHGVDVVFCRNVFIYFNREEQERMLQVFWSGLSRGGYLVLGRSERLAPSMAERFELVSSRERVYRKLA